MKSNISEERKFMKKFVKFIDTLLCKLDTYKWFPLVWIFLLFAVGGVLVTIPISIELKARLLAGWIYFWMFISVWVLYITFRQIK